MSKEPEIRKELVEYLEVVFPDRCPSPDAEERDIWRAVGAVEVTRHLRRLHELQTNPEVDPESDL